MPTEPVRRPYANVDRDWERVRPSVRKLIDQAIREKDWPITIIGPTGCGKTCAALCLLDRYGGAYYPLPEFESACQAYANGTLPEEGGFDWHWISNRCSYNKPSCLLFVLDDLGRRGDVSEFKRDSVTRLIDGRTGLPLIVTTNKSLDDLGVIYDRRVKSRLSGGAVIEYPADAPDLRVQK